MSLIGVVQAHPSSLTMTEKLLARILFIIFGPRVVVSGLVKPLFDLICKVLGETHV